MLKSDIPLVVSGFFVTFAVSNKKQTKETIKTIGNMEKITFDQLQQLVANIDYIYPDSYPIVFRVTHKRGGIRNYEAGIGRADGEIDPDNLTEECQYLAERDTCHGDVFRHVIDVQEPDNMKVSEIGQMLREKCKIKDGDTIWFNRRLSCTGKRFNDFEKVELSWPATMQILRLMGYMTREEWEEENADEVPDMDGCDFDEKLVLCNDALADALNVANSTTLPIHGFTTEEGETYDVAYIDLNGDAYLACEDEDKQDRFNTPIYSLSEKDLDRLYELFKSKQTKP